MSRILGLDLGTNSIGWAIRETDRLERESYKERFSRNVADPTNEIVDYGVVVFKKGVGEGKSGEFSLAAERRKNRSKRRLYNAKRYRKRELLKVLIDNDMCPLTHEELRLWSVGKWSLIEGKRKNLGRIYPLNNESFQKWLSMDPSYFGNRGFSEYGKPVRKNPYDLRLELIEREESDDFVKRQKVGRALYHLVQRRGFKSSRKSGKSTYAENEELEKIKSENPNYHIATLAKEKLDRGERFRASGVIQRRYFEDEFHSICLKQCIDPGLTSKLHTAIYFVRPLRSQKGLVGNCTLEKTKKRIPASHPRFEEFRALSFINTIKRREKGTKVFEPLPIAIKKQILEEIFFKRVESGQNKGKVNERSYFKFDEIIERFSEAGRYEFNYENRPNVSTCPVIAALMNVFTVHWTSPFIGDEGQFGINWEGLSISYTVKYGRNVGKSRTLGVDGIWHLLFDFVQTKDRLEELEMFCRNVLAFDDDTAIAFSEIAIPRGYGSLSHNAISKIVPFLREGFVYAEAVLFANLKSVLGDRFENAKREAKEIIRVTIKDVQQKKKILSIVNRLIQDFFAEGHAPKAKGVDEHIVGIATLESERAIHTYFGEHEWASKPDAEKDRIRDEVMKYYLKFLEGRQERDEKASAGTDSNPEIDYYKLPRLDVAIRENLKAELGLPHSSLRHLYHPSDIEVYPPSRTEVIARIADGEVRVRQLESPQPPSRGWKNPMAMRTLHELRHLLNYLLRVGKICQDTKVVVEMARELNDANRRWAIQTYQRLREEENKEFAKAIVGVAREKYPNLDEKNIENINKVRLWWEQMENSDEVYREIKALKEDVLKYRFWKEQECACMYTGEMISIADLFDGSQTHFEHTLPIGESFDNSLANLTVCKEYYNTNIKKDRIPTQLENYLVDANGFTAIEPRLKKWQDKVDRLRGLIDANFAKTRKILDPEKKKELIQRRHLLQFDYEYWKRKLATFTVNEIPRTWKNSQLVDTQIISRYARAYLKTVFERVDVQKGTIVSDFQKMYRIRGDEQKDRSKHSHHAVDAAVLTLVPGSAKRDSLLKEYYAAVSKGTKFYTKPYVAFEPTHILGIEANLVVNHIVNDRTLVETFKWIRKGRGHKAFARGRTIRGQIHKETYFGAVKVPERNENGFAIKHNDGFRVRKDPVSGQDQVWIVSRRYIKDLKIVKGKLEDVIVDELLQRHIQSQLDNGVPLAEVVDFNGKRIRHIRVRVRAGVGFLSSERALAIKEHVYKSKHEHKQYVLTQNEENYLFLLYEGIDSRGKVVRSYRILNLFDIAQLSIKRIEQLQREPEFQSVQKGRAMLRLKRILRVGDRMVLFKNSRDEITASNIRNRLYVLFKFNEMGTPYLYLRHHLEARPNDELPREEVEFIPERYQPRLALKISKLNCLFEGIDFDIEPDGTIRLH
jgi:CRISPR-associated endonuclease Csn1